MLSRARTRERALGSSACEEEREVHARQVGRGGRVDRCHARRRQPHRIRAGHLVARNHPVSSPPPALYVFRDSNPGMLQAST